MHLLKEFLEIIGAGGTARTAPRVLAYCASNIGMGHYGRLARIMGELRRLDPRVSVLMAGDIRDSALAHEAGAAVLRLPGYRFNEDGRFGQHPENLKIANKELHQLRRQLLLTAAREFRPHLVVMDTLPHGKQNEMLPVIRRQRRLRNARTVLILRDIPAPKGERFRFARDAHSVEREARYYDRVLVAGDRRFFDVAESYDWPAALRQRLDYIGFVIPSQPPPATRREALAAFPQVDPDQPLVIVSLGGGWTQGNLPLRLVEGLSELRRRQGRMIQMLMLTGPATERAELETVRAQCPAGVCVERFSLQLAACLRQAELAILQAGSTAYQILESATPIVLLCRNHSSREQEERALRLASFPGIRFVNPVELEHVDFASLMEWGLTAPREERRTGFAYDGTAQAARILAGLLQ